MRLLIACEFSGAVRDAFTARGHYARSCDLLPTESHAPVVFAGDLPLCECCGEEPWCPLHEMHYGDCVCVGPTEDEAEYDEASFETADPRGARHLSGDLFSLDPAELAGYDALIAHPPCTRLTNSGVRWLNERNLWAEMYEAADFFRRILDLPVPKIAVENPIPHRYALERIGRKYDQIIQPWQFGHGETKATCLWLKNLPKLVPTNIVSGREARIHKLPPSADRWKLRSMTYQGIAEAMADQWGGLDAWSAASASEQPFMLEAFA